MKIPMTKSFINEIQSVVDNETEEFSVPGAFRVYHDEKLGICVLELLEVGDSNPPFKTPPVEEYYRYGGPAVTVAPNDFEDK